MSSDRIIEVIAKTTTRRRFIGKLGAVAGGLGLTSLGMSRSAFSATPPRPNAPPPPDPGCGIEYCCNLCNSGCPQASCSGCACTWAWTCPWNPGGGHTYTVQCGECFSSTIHQGDCQKACPSGDVPCSWAIIIG
jgi:hypothetical protein